jgi:hypothetical protein
MEKSDRTRTALTLAIVNSGLLWWWTYQQILTDFCYGLPLFSLDSYSMEDFQYLNLQSYSRYFRSPHADWNRFAKEDADRIDEVLIRYEAVRCLQVIER